MIHTLLFDGKVESIAESAAEVRAVTRMVRMFEAKQLPPNPPVMESVIYLAALCYLERNKE